MDGPIVTVLGGTGFLGRQVVRALLRSGFAVRIGSRHAASGRNGRTDDAAAGAAMAQPVQVDIGDETSLAAALAGAFAAVNCVSLYVERDGQTFQSVHVEGAERVARMARQAKVPRLAHVSGIGSDSRSSSAYVESRGRGEEVVRAAFPDAVLIRPAVMFGPGDSFVVPLLGLLRRLPVFALFGRGETRLQPSFVGDVAEGIARALKPERAVPATYELAGPDILTYAELVRQIARCAGARPMLLPMPFVLWHALALVAERLPSPFITRNQVELMQLPNVAQQDRPGLRELGIAPKSLADLLPEIARTAASPQRPNG